MNEIIAYVFIILGIVFNLLGCIGLIRLPDVYNRLQASTKCVTIGTCGIMLGIFAWYGFQAAGIKALLCAIFLIITAPAGAHALARAAHMAGVKLWKNSVCDKFEEDK